MVLNGDHPMAQEDDAYVLRHYVPVPDEPDWPRAAIHEAMVSGSLPLPSYLLSDGELMVHPDYLDLIRAAGTTDGPHAWFLEQWPEAERSVAEAEWDGYVSGQYVCLHSVSPATIQRKTHLIDGIRALAERPDGGSDRAIRPELVALVDALDDLMPPFTGYDRLRFGGPTSRDMWIDGVRQRI